MKKYSLGEKFKTACDLSFKGFFIPRDTQVEVIEQFDDSYYKLYFNCIGNENHQECIQIMDACEIKNITI